MKELTKEIFRGLMDIKPTTSASTPLPSLLTQTLKSSQATGTQTQTASAVTEPAAEKDSAGKTAKKSSSKLPYVAGAIVLAGLGAYLYRGRIFNASNLKNAKNHFEEMNPNLRRLTHNPEVKGGESAEALKPDKIEVLTDKFKDKLNNKEFQKFRIDKKDPDIQDVLPVIEEIKPQKAATVINEVKEAAATAEKETGIAAETIANKAESAEPLSVVTNEFGEKSKVKNIFTGWNEGKPVYEEIEMIPFNKAEPAKSAFAEALKAVNLYNEKVISKIKSVKQGSSAEVSRIINENVKDGHVDLKIMNKVARDFANDEKGRGADRFHQAAEILEQSLVKEFVKGDKKEMTGLQNIFDRASQDSPLFEIYKKMPVEEAASRLRHLADNDLKSEAYKGMDAEKFFEKSFNRLVEKIQFQGYNDARGIKVSL